jgi:hypothetical protein
MAEKSPLVFVDGGFSQLPPGDSIEGVALGSLVAGSGLVGGGDLNTGNKRLDIGLTASPSGLIFVGDALGLDGSDQATADAALASGNAGLELGTVALASGVAAQSEANTALASGIAALDAAVNFQGSSSLTFTAASAVASGYAVGLDDGGKVQSVREVVDADSRVFGSAVVFESAFSIYISTTYDSTNNKIVIAYQDSGNSSYGTAIVGTVSGTSISFGTAVVFESANSDYISTTYDSTNNKVVIAYRDVGNSNYGTAIVADALLSYSYNPTVNSYPNVLGIAQSTVASGSPCLVNLPGTLYNEPAANLTTGAFYYADPTTSGITTTSTQATSWNGQVPWNYIGRAVTSSGLMLLKSI